MSLYEAIQTSYEEREARMALQLNLLAKAAGNMASHFRHYLGLQTARWHHPDGKAGDDYIRLGTGSPNSFEEKPWMTLSSRNGVVPFSLAVTIVSEDRMFRATYVFEMTVHFILDGYLFTLGENDEELVSVDYVKADNFDPVHKMISARLMSLLDPAKIMIKN